MITELKQQALICFNTAIDDAAIRKIESVVAKVSGIRSVAINRHIKRVLEVCYDPRQIRMIRLVRTLKNEGLDAAVVDL